MKKTVMLSFLGALVVCVIIATVVVLVVAPKQKKREPETTAKSTTATMPPETITKSSVTTSTPTKPRPQSTKTTTKPTTTTATQSTIRSTPTKQRTLSTAKSTATTTTMLPEPTTKSSTTPPTSTTSRPEPTDAPSKLKCLAVFDFYNFDLSGVHQTAELRLINDAAERLFRNEDFESIGIWIYGHARRCLSIDESLNKMYTDLRDFQDDLWDNDVVKVEKALNTSDAIKVINRLEDPKRRANCLIFFSAQQDTSTLPRLDPNPSRSAFQRIVAIGFNETDLRHVVVPPRGVALSIPLYYMGWHLEAVVNAILKKP